MAKRKSREQAADETPAANPDTLVDFPPPETPPEVPVATHAPAEHGDAHEGPADQGTEKKKEWPDPRTSHNIELGEGRRIHFGRSSRWQQNLIFLTAPEGVDPRPSKEDTEFLKQNGFRWRGEDKAWARQFLTPEDKADVETISHEDGEDAARRERGKLRAASDAVAQDTFVELANRIRARNGKDPVEYTFSQQHER